MKIKVLIADDNSFIREGMRIILSTFGDFDVLATVENGQEAVDFCKSQDVDVALLDVRMPVMNGVEATRRLTLETKTRPMILTTFDDDEYILDAIRYGAKGYLLKNNDPERIRDAIKSVHSGNNVLQDVVLDKLKSSMDLLRPVDTASKSESAEGRSGDKVETKRTAAPAGGPGRAGTTASMEVDYAQGSTGQKEVHGQSETKGLPFDPSPFTERELGVMSLVARGLSNKEISKELFISEGTTANYITSILGKTLLEHRTQIAIYYLTGRVR
ncbi:response regulator transcription factor [Paenibacillus tuaregi]|uniref:response regulator transcription factor n=1 Tax=Paenibacillus tuaregi TaxID=1816681 RepID=UPI0008386E25|nr:response regulator transcription factor [Paenibacillus tuaregi]